jgi:hypothetical protein
MEAIRRKNILVEEISKETPTADPGLLRTYAGCLDFIAQVMMTGPDTRITELVKLLIDLAPKCPCQNSWQKSLAEPIMCSLGLPYTDTTHKYIEYWSFLPRDAAPTVDTYDVLCTVATRGDVVYKRLIGDGIGRLDALKTMIALGRDAFASDGMPFPFYSDGRRVGTDKYGDAIDTYFRCIHNALAPCQISLDE